MSELIWDVAVAYEWRISVNDQVSLAHWMAGEKRVTQRALTDALERLGVVTPKGVVIALCRRVADYDRRRLGVSRDH